MTAAHPGTTGGSNTDYVFSPSIDEPLAVYAGGAVSYLNADGLGSIVATNGATGTVTQGSVFDAWGVAKSETGTRAHSFTYTGRETGEAGLHFYRARSLQPGAGRFTQEDPIGLLGGPNVFIYAASRPSYFIDPLGLRVHVALTERSPVYSLANRCSQLGVGVSCYGRRFYVVHPCRGSEGCYGFDVDVSLSIGEQFAITREEANSSQSAESPGLTLQEHEDLHMADFRWGFSEVAVNNAVRTEGFRTKKACNAARDRVRRRIERYLLGVVDATREDRDMPH